MRNFATIAGFTGVSGNVTARMFVYGVSPKKIQLEKILKFHVGCTKKFAKQKSSEIKNKVGASYFFFGKK